MKRALKKKRRTLGMAMVEMVFVLPLLILILFGIAEFGLMFQRWLSLSNAVREGARYGVDWQGTSCNSGTLTTQVQNTVVAYAHTGGVPISAANVTVTGACNGTNTPLTVSASSPFNVNIPFATVGTVNLSYSSTMRNE
jgi:Flp pilus assembly protein TadG